MGIKNLSILYKGDETIVTSQHIETFRGKRLAIDGGIWLNSTWCSAVSRHIDETNVLLQELDVAKIRKYWLDRAKDDVRLYLSHHIVPLFVFDGQAPQDKEITWAKRKEELDKAREKLSFIEQKKDDLFQQQDVDKARKILKACRTVPMPKDDTIKSILQALGIPFLTCNQESERLCSALYRDGWVDGVVSSDTDCLTHGCGLLITKIQGRIATVINLHPLLNKLDVTYKQFVDLCIACGCDYNTNIPRIGPKKSLKLLKQYGRLEQFPYDTTCLNYQRCRELFRLIPSEQLTHDPINDDTVNIGALHPECREILESCDASDWLDDLISLLNIEPVQRCRYIRNPQPLRL